MHPPIYDDHNIVTGGKHQERFRKDETFDMGPPVERRGGTLRKARWLQG
jgi:hypothetical protein